MATDTKIPVTAAKGGGFLVEDRSFEEAFTPEDFTEVPRKIAQTAVDLMVTASVNREIGGQSRSRAMRFLKAPALQ